MPTLIERIKSLFGREGGNDKPQEGKMYYYKLGTMKFPDFTQRMMEDYFDAGKLDAKGNTAWKEEHPSRTDIPDFPVKEKPENMSVSGGKFVFEDSFWYPDRNDINPDMRPIGTFGGLTFVDREAGQVYVSDTHRVDVYQNVSEEEVKAVLRGYNKTHNIRLDSMDAPLHDIAVAMLESGELKPEAVEKAVKTHKAASDAKSRTAVKEDTARELQTALKTLAFKDRIKDKRNTIVLARQGGEVRAYGHDARLLNELTDVKSKTIKTFKKEGSRNVPGKGIFTAAVPKDEEDSVARYFAGSEDRGYDVVVIDADNGFRKCNEMKGNILERNNRISAARNKGLYYLPVVKVSDLYSKESYDGIIDLFKKGDTAAILRQAKDSIGQLDDRNTYRFADELHKDCPAYDYYYQYFGNYSYIKKPYVLAENRDYAVAVMMNDDEETTQTDIDSKYREELVMYRKYTSQRLRDAMASSDYLKGNWDKIIYGDEVHEQLVTNDAKEVMKVVFRKPFIRGLVQKEKDLAATLGKGFEWNRDRDSVGLELKVPRRSRDYGEDEYYDYISSVRYDKGRLMVNNRTLTKNKPMDEPARISDKDFNCLYNISNVYKEGDDIKVKGTCVRLGNEGKEEPLDTSICNIGTDALKDLSEAIHNRYSLNMLMDYIRERAGEDSVIRFRQPFEAKDGKAYTSLTTMDRNFYLKTEKGDKDFYSGMSHEDYDALRRFLMEDKIRNTLASYYDIFKEGQDMGGTKFNFYDPDTKREFYIDTVYAGADGNVTIRGSYTENYGIHTFNSDLGILGPGGLEILDEFIADQGNFVLEQRSREPEFEKRYAPLDFTPGNEYMVRDENGDDLFVISASDHPNFEKNNPDVTYGFLDGKPEYGYIKPYKKDVQASHEYYEQNQARLSHSIIQQNPGHIYYALTAKIWKGVYEGTNKLFRDKNWKELADRAPLDGTPIERGIDFSNVYSRFWNNPGNISEVQAEGDRYAVAIVSDGDYETKDNPHEKEYAEVFTKYTAREMKDIIRGMSQNDRDRVREFLSPDIAPLFEETEREMRQEQTRKTAPVPAAKAVGDWHGDDQNLMRAYSELGALFADWRDGFTRKGLGSPLPMEYRYRDAYPVNSLSMSLWSQKNNFKVQVYITQEQAQEHGIKPVGKGVPYLRKTADGVAVTRAYNIEETDYNAIKDSRPDTAKWLSELMRDTVDTENTWNLSAAAANAFRGKENPWVTRIEYRDDIVKDGGPSVRYDSERDTIAVHPDPGATEDLRADSMMNALTDSLLLTGRLRQMYPKDAAYSDTARMMNAIQSGTDFELCQSRVTYNMEPFSFLSSDNVSKRLREDPAFVRDLMDVSSDVTLTIESRAGALDKGVRFDDKLGVFRDEQASESAGKAVAPDEEKGQEEDRSKGIRL